MNFEIPTMSNGASKEIEGEAAYFAQKIAGLQQLVAELLFENQRLRLGLPPAESASVTFTLADVSIP